MSSTLDYAESEPSSLNIGSGEVLHAALGCLWRRKLLVGAIVAAVIALGLVALFVMPKTYTAEAYIRGGFAASIAVAKDDEGSRNAPAISLDLSRVIETQSRLMESQDLARRVVQQLGLEQLRPELSQSHWLPNPFRGNAPSTQADEIDRAATQLLRGLSVTSDPRTYMIEVLYTAREPALADVIANAFVAEFLRSSRLQALSLQRSSAAAALSRQLAIFGDKHPRVVKAEMQLSAADDLLKKQLGESPNVILQNVGQNVTMATAGPSKRSMPLVVGLLLLVGLIAGISAALWLERRRWTETFLRYYMRPFA
ncbi:MAG TPA: Wzz/FepE/Etk N-terminal domain-containing protein [Hyphomicrobiales bacterium]|jgi:uncharacterized protein involved in exopolysaccharide biosynthesis